MDKKTHARGFFFRLAVNNIRHNRKTYVPYLVATAMISGVTLLISGLMFSKTLKNLPTGETAAAIFTLGLVIFSIFAACFMSYINYFLIGQRRREFGLYGVLGLEKRHVGRVLLIENALVLGGGVLLGCVGALLFGQLVFWLLLRVIRAVPGSTFSIGFSAYALTFGLFALIFIGTSLSNVHQVRLASPMELMQSERKGEKETKLLVPLAALGLIALAVSYYYAWTINDAFFALATFFGLVALVIFATYALCTAGSVVLLKALRRRRRFYYQAKHFVTVSGLIQRMRQNAAGLATIAILSTMLIVSVSGTLALYLGQEELLSGMYPYDVEVSVAGEPDDAAIQGFERTMLTLAAAHNVTLSADPAKLTNVPPENERFLRNHYVSDSARQVALEKLLFFGSSYRFDAAGEPDDCIAFCGDVRDAYRETFSEAPRLIVGEVFTARRDGYGLYGGLLFLGVFFGLLFLSVTVLLIYFKQITEGYEDRARFVILQKVGMDDSLVKQTINAQVLLMFFIPLGVAALHMLFASRIMARMLQTFMLYDWGLVLRCIGGVLAGFVLMYLAIYRMTTRVYYRIVKW